MLSNISIGRFKKTGVAVVIDSTKLDNGEFATSLINSGTSAQDHAFANNVERTLREKGCELEVITLETQYGGEMTKCKETK